METITTVAIIALNVQTIAALYFMFKYKQEEKKNELLNKYYKRQGEIIKEYEKLIDKHVKKTYDTVNKAIDEITNPKESERTKSQKELEQNKLQEKETKDEQTEKR